MTQLSQVCNLVLWVEKYDEILFGCTAPQIRSGPITAHPEPVSTQSITKYHVISLAGRTCEAGQALAGFGGTPSLSLSVFGVLYRCACYLSSVSAYNTLMVCIADLSPPLPSAMRMALHTWSVLCAILCTSPSSPHSRPPPPLTPTPPPPPRPRPAAAPSTPTPSTRARP